MDPVLEVGFSEPPFFRIRIHRPTDGVRVEVIKRLGNEPVDTWVCQTTITEEAFDQLVGWLFQHMDFFRHEGAVEKAVYGIGAVFMMLVAFGAPSVHPGIYTLDASRSRQKASVHK